jgi:hypothetical protein
MPAGERGEGAIVVRTLFRPESDTFVSRDRDRVVRVKLAWVSAARIHFVFAMISPFLGGRIGLAMTQAVRRFQTVPSTNDNDSTAVLDRQAVARASQPPTDPP